ncbi:MAG TPA: hypothetical protein DCO75_08765 [Fibrobacteres bacterium]|nr:hypothetical protein [Fibrobacterota bacterium]
MNAKIFNLLILSMLCLVIVNLTEARINNINSQVASIFNNTNDVRMAYYRVVPKAFSESGMTSKLNFIKAEGFIAANRSEDSNRVIINDTSLTQQFAYVKSVSTYQYINNKVGGLTDADLADTSKLKVQADNALSNLCGVQAENYQFINKEIEWRVTELDTNKRINSIGFRYVKIIDGRVILGTTSHIVITLGQNKRIKRFILTDPDLITIGNVQRQIKTSAMNKYLNNHLASEGYNKNFHGEKININETTVKWASTSYFPIKKGNDLILVPHISFYSEDSLEDGKMLKREFHLVQDADRMANCDAQDVMDYGKSMKK